MSVDYKCRQIYNDVIHDVTKTEEAWKSVLSLCGRIYRYEFDNVLMVYAQRPKSTLIADFDTWKKVDRYVKRGSKGIAIYPSRALSPYCRYVFDISDTGGRNVKLTWILEGDYLTDYAKRLAWEGSITLTGNESPVDLKNKIWDFTKSEVRGILREKHAMRVSVLAGKLGDQIVSSRQDVRDDGLQIIERSIFYVVAGRCGFDQPKGENELGTITQIVKEDMIFELGSLVSDVSCEVLRNISRSIKEIERERRMSYERGTTVQRGSRRDAVSEHHNGEGKSVPNREIRSDGDGLSKGKPLREVSVSGEIWEINGDFGSGERGSVSDGGTDDGAVSAVPSGEEPGRHDGDVENQRAGTEADTGDHRSRSDQQVPLESETVKADETPHAPNDGAKGEYHQISFMDMMAPPAKPVPRSTTVLMYSSGTGSFFGFR